MFYKSAAIHPTQVYLRSGGQSLVFCFFSCQNDGLWPPTEVALINVGSSGGVCLCSGRWCDPRLVLIGVCVCACVCAGIGFASLAQTHAHTYESETATQILACTQAPQPTHSFTHTHTHTDLTPQNTHCSSRRGGGGLVSPSERLSWPKAKIFHLS